MSAPRRNKKMVHLPLDPELHAVLGEYARRHRRSMTNALEYLLAGALISEPENGTDEVRRPSYA